LMANQQLADLLGYDTPEALRGVHITEHLPLEEHARVAGKLEQRAQGLPITSKNAQYTVLRRDGSAFPAEVSSTVLFAEGIRPATITATVRDVTERAVAEERLRHQAMHDALTGLPNRALLHDRLEQAMLSAERSSDSLALLMLDLDRFKEVNDSLGHDVGDAVLREVSARLQRVLRASDTVARLGGDEFAFVLPDTDVLGAQNAAAKIHASLRPAVAAGSHQLPLE